MDGIVVGCSPNSKALLVYNPGNKKNYKPDSYRLDPYRLPGLAYPSVKYDGGLFVNLLCDDNPQFEEKYPPGMRIECIDPSSHMLVSGTVMDIPFPVDISNPVTNSSDLPYSILLDNGTYHGLNPTVPDGQPHPSASGLPHSVGHNGISMASLAEW
jgi:hypothetical protein